MADNGMTIKHPDSSKQRYLPDEVAEMLEKLIRTHDLKPGTRLPSERKLAEIFQLNRTTIHHGIHILQKRGLVNKKVGHGTFVNSIHPSTVADSFERYFHFQSCTREDLLSVRAMLEPEIAAQAAEKASDEEIEQLCALVDRMDLMKKEMGGIDPEVDRNFHLTLAAATHNELLKAIVYSIQQIMFRWLTIQYQTDRFKERKSNRSYRIHRNIYLAVAARDPEAARQAMIEHQQLVMSTLHQPEIKQSKNLSGYEALEALMKV